MNVTETFTNAAGATYAALVDFDGVTLIATCAQGEMRLDIWGPAQGMASTNPGWAKLDELCVQGLARFICEGLSIAPNDRHVWLGGPIPGLDAARA